VLTHQNLMCQSLTLIRVWRLFADEEVNLCASPLFHIASIGAIAPMVLIGGTTVLLPSGGFSSTATLELMEAERVTSVFSCRLNGNCCATTPRWPAATCRR
jgi:Acyl-CoA synthetases (AMP-forming)/AMP-acid ligases II